MQTLKLFVTGHKGFETLLFHELRAVLGATDAVLEKKYGGVGISAGIDAVYRLCLHSRLANRVFCELARAPVEDEAQLYQAVYAIDWGLHMEARNSIAVSATLSRSKLNHGHFVVLRVKDAIVDQFRERCGSRPVVAKKQPDIQVHVNIHHNQATISLDLSGESLHRRGYRLQHTGAPLKEHLAAALLVQAGWNSEAGEPRRLLDPMCGSGTFVIEAAMMAANIAPGLEREYFGFKRWLMHDAQRWQACLEQAREAIIAQPQVEICASDYDANALQTALANARRAGVEHMIEFSHQQVGELELAPAKNETLVICNPPYGQRLQAEHGLAELYTELGAAVRRLAPARLATISANPDLLHRLKMQRLSRKDVRNGPLQCLFAIYASAAEKDLVVAETAPQAVDKEAAMPAIDEEAAVPLYNRLVKNARHLQRWAKRNDVSCYRIYDADLPEFAFSLDRYQSDVAPGLEWFHLQEYQAPATIDAATAEHRIKLAMAVVKQVFAVSDDRLFCKTRSRQRGSAQYQKQDNQAEFFQVREGAASLLINLSDYLDSGLFLDHRITRDMVYRQAGGKRILNLFCYTAAVGVLAGLGGAARVVNIDMSVNYLKWARENHLLNRLDDDERYQFIRADIVELLNHPHRFSLQREFDLIFLDPPSFSNSSKMRETLDIQRDHASLIGLAMDLLKSDGLLLFSTNRRGFKLAREIDETCAVRDITHSTIAEDFRRNPKIHLCWEIRHGTA
ncbi:MAG: bifunctional 23S rRNA (guanine(2069)-N(7))-methyltransferase RlmK/23S rRNA (guanine(2445)-N(2))-methyltransferase RlmL [Gammaproteobacteria bacterium]|nr:bifunctional 23S rRNA (guanine(2069)-N(7))-methyltransferase RlmK/23S rRNA (guanine(2445)-N(2))-methyltransferase RlmL [Gammaproteobacteria bacterium]